MKEIKCMCSTHTDTTKQINKISLKRALGRAVVDVFVMKSGGFCHMQLMVINYKDTEQVKTKHRQKGSRE